MPDVPCSKCAGSGRAPLTRHLQRALDVCRRLTAEGRTITAASVVVAPEVAPERVGSTAASNWLAELERLGFLRRGRRVQRRLVYHLEEAS